MVVLQDVLGDPMIHLDITDRLRDPKYDCAEEAADKIEMLRAELDRLRAIEAVAFELISSKGMRMTPDGLVVVERKDNSDPHYRLCTLLGNPL